MSKWVLIVISVVIVQFSFGQTKQELEEKKRESYNKIKYTNQLLKENQKTKKANYNQLILLNKKIEVRNEIINDFSKEIEIINQRIIDNQELVVSLTEDLEKLKKEYEKVIVNSYKNRKKYERLMFILSAKDFNQAYRRIRYIKEYTEFRKKQASIIKDTRSRIEETLKKLDLEKAEKNELIYEKEEENTQLAEEVGQKRILIKTLKSKEKDLRDEIKKQEEIALKIQKKIEEIIAEEARRAAERAKGNMAMLLTPEERLISDEFGKNQRRLPWPTERGIVTEKFGEHEHPVLKGVRIRNDGVDIATTQNAIARAVFEGEVSRVFAIPGANKAVIIRHGNYLTVYSNLKEVIVTAGQKVEVKQALGVIYTDKNENNKTVLKFQIWKENNKLNPEYWLAKNSG